MKNNFTLYMVTLIAAIGGLLFGYDTGVIGGTQLYFTEYFGFSASQQGFAVASAIYGCLFGALIAGYLTKAISRKYTLILSGILFVVSAWGSGAADSYMALVLYRIIGGIGIGLASMAAPMLIAEIAPPHRRGFFVSMYQLAIVIGFFIVFLATYFIGCGETSTMSEEALAALNQYNTERGWRVMFWSELLPAGLFLVLLFFIHISPRWLMLIGREAEAAKVLSKVCASESLAHAELENIKSSLAADKPAGFDVLLKYFGPVLIIGVLLSIFQQVTGINAILYYGAEIFSNALGYGPEDALKQQLWLGAVNLLFTFVAIFTVDRWGRKPLLLTGISGMFLGLSVLGWTIYSQQLGIVSLIAILLFIGSFAMSMGPIVWVLLSEIFPNRVRSAAMAIAVGAQWLFNGIVANTFPVINKSQLNTESFNGALPYFIFAFFCIVTILFVWLKVPETKGQSLEELESLWENRL